MGLSKVVEQLKQALTRKKEVRCSRCNRILLNARCRERGIGVICARKANGWEQAQLEKQGQLTLFEPGGSEPEPSSTGTLPTALTTP